MLETVDRRDITLLDVANTCRDIAEELSCDTSIDDVFMPPRQGHVSGCDSGFSASGEAASTRHGVCKVCCHIVLIVPFTKYDDASLLPYYNEKMLYNLCIIHVCIVCSCIHERNLRGFFRSCVVVAEKMAA